ncbi:MAG TPA: DUF3987 domain-containing protein [bacterium]|nr:DUF3987 domain-containing protein [bacterium]
MQTKLKRNRKLGESWLSAYRHYIIKQESPDIFHFWIAMSMVAASLKRNVFVDRNAYQVYPNQYIFLVAESALCKKSAAMDIGIDLIQKIEDITVVHGRATVEGLIDLMNKAAPDPTGTIKPDGSILVHADELAYLFGKASYITDLITFFTAAYTSRARLDFLTRKTKLVKVRNPCPSILAGTTPGQMGDIFPSLTLSSGFMGRVLLIWGSSVKRVAEPALRREMEDALIHDLGCISQLCGEIKMTEEAKTYFNSWYEALKPPDMQELLPFFQRKHDHALKAAICISVAESDKMVITLDHLNAAISAIEYVEARIPDAIASIGATIQSTIGDQIVNIIRSKAPSSISHSMVLRRIYKRLNYGAQEFQQIIESLKQAEKIKEVASERGIFYTLWSKKGKS